MYTLIGFLAKPMGYLLSLLNSLVGNYGISIIIFTLIVKLALYPLYAKQIMSTMRMSEMQPKMKEIQTKYANDKETMNIKMSELYKKEKFNPMGGCLPMIIQMILIFGLFALLRNPLQYITDDSMIFAVHESFLWMPDLSQPDKWILPILAGVATFVAFSMNQAQQAGVPGQGAGMMKAMKYVFPVLIVFMGRTFPSGLAIYWSISQVIQIFYNLRFQKLRIKIQAEKEHEKRAKKHASAASN